MPSSGEIAQMFAQQQAMFSQSNAFATQVGIQTPNTSLGAWGVRGGGMQQAPGGPQWSYASGGMLGPGYGGGNQFAGHAMSAMGGVAAMGGVGLGLAAGFGKLGPFGGLIDPFGGFSAAFKAAGGALNPSTWSMGNIGAGFMGAMPALGIGMAASHMLGSTIAGGHQAAGVAREMGQFQFGNAQSRTGMGFTRDDARAVETQIRQMAYVPQMLTSMSELTQLLPKLRQSGMMQGVTEITEFQTRFKDAVGTVKMMSKMLGTTMGEAADFFAHSRSVGFLGRSAQLQNTLNAQYTGALTGMTTGQVMGMQQAGAQAFRAQGVSGRSGAMAATNWAQQLGMGQQTGSIGEGVLEDITGATGAEAVNQAAQRFSQAAFQMTQNTAAGALTVYGLTKFDENGKAIGIDQAMAERFKRGEVSYHELKSRVGRLTNAQKISAVAYKRDIGGLVATMGPAAITGVLGDALEERGHGGDDALNLMIQRSTGMSAIEAGVVISQRNEAGAQGGGDFSRTRMREAIIREKYSPAAYMQKFKTALKNVTTRPFEEMGSAVYNSLAKEFDKFFDDLVGRHVVTMTKESAESFKQMMAGGGSEVQRELNNLTLGGDITGKNRDSRYSMANSLRTGLTTSTLGLGKLVNYGMASALGLGHMGINQQLEMIMGNEREDAQDEYAKRESRRLRAVGGDATQAAVRRLGGKGVGGVLAGDVESWQLSQPTEDRQNASKAVAGLAETHAGRLVESVMQLNKSHGADKGVVTGMIARGDIKSLSQYTGVSEEEMLRKGNNTLKVAILTKRKLEAEKQGSTDGVPLSALTAGAAAGSAGLNVASASKEDMRDVGIRPDQNVRTEQEIKTARDEATEGLGKLFGADSAFVTSGKARRAGYMLATADSKFVEEIASSKDDSTIRKMMSAKFGMNLNDTEIESMRKLAGHMRKEGGLLTSTKELFTQGVGADNDAANMVMRKRLRESASAQGEAVRASGYGEGSKEAELGGGLASALANLGEFKTTDDFAAKSGGVRDALGAAIEHAKGLKGEEYSKFIASLGDFGGVVSKGAKSSQRLGKKSKVSLNQLETELGISAKDKELFEKTLNDQGFTGSSFNFTSAKGREDLANIEKTVAGMRAQGLIAAPGSQVTNKDAEIVAALKEIQQTSKLQTSLLATIAKVDQSEVDRLQRAYAPDAAAGREGQTNIEKAKK